MPDSRSSRTSQVPVLGPPDLAIRDVARFQQNASHPAHLQALERIEMAHAFGAAAGDDFVDFQPRRNDLVRAFGLANTAVDVLSADHQRDGEYLKTSKASAIAYPTQPLRRQAAPLPAWPVPLR